MMPRTQTSEFVAIERLEHTLHAMESDRNANGPLLIGIAISVVFHSFLLVPSLRSMLDVSHDGSDRSRAASFSVEKEVEKRDPLTDEQKQNELQLGIENGTTKPTMTWIGYEEYQEHLARLSEVDQAAFRDTDQGGQPMPEARQNQPLVPQVPQPAEAAPPAPDAQQPSMSEARPPSPAHPPVQPPSPTKPPSQHQAKPQPTSQVASDPSTKPSAPPPISAATEEATATSKDAIAIPVADQNKIEPMIQPVAKAIDSKEKEAKDAPPPPKADKPLDEPPTPPDPQTKAPTEKPSPDEKPSPTDTPSPTEPTPPSESPSTPQNASPPPSPPPTKAAEGQQQPSASPTTGPSPDPSARPGAKPGPKADGDLSDRESDATSTINVPPSQWRNGKPLAAKGLKVLTKRPYFDELTSVTTAPGSPLASIEFDRTGKAVNCVLVESSGYRDVDQAILDSLFGWKAQGPQLEKLKPGETVKFKIRLLLK